MKFKSFDELGSYFGRTKRKPQKEWADEQKSKILTCPRCKNTLTWIEGTNILVCRNVVSEDKICNFRKTINDKTFNFLGYLNS